VPKKTMQKAILKSYTLDIESDLCMQYPKISIVTPSYNCKALIAQTLDSVLSQNYPNLELIVIDGNSTDGTQQVLEHYSNSFAYWQSQKDQGQYDAINQGFAKSTGEIMAWLNADDMLLPNSLFVVAEIFEQLAEVEWISSLQPASWDANGYLAKVNSLPGFNQQAFLDGLYLPTTAKKGYWLQQESTFWRRSLWQKAGSSIPNYDLAGDFALWCKFYELTDLYGVSYPLGGFRMIEGQRSEDYESYMTQATHALQEARANLRWNSNASNQLIYRSLPTMTRIHQFLTKRYGYEGAYIQKNHPRKINSPWSIEHRHFLP
jgi:glycosyltransferase involved in cell wall biosynthesis